MTDHEPNPAAMPPADNPSVGDGDAVVSPPQEGSPLEDVAGLLFPALALKPGESAATVITKPAIAAPSPQLGQWATRIRGRRLAHFELEEPLGVGGMAAVIRAKDTLLDRTVALKILPPEMAADAENIQRFHNEARSAAQLDHENIARVYFYGEDQGLHFIAFEYVEGETLHHRLERLGLLPVAEALQITLQVAAGLVHAAARGMVHRDIKPSNIIVSRSGRAKLVDMGLARSIMTARDKGLTQSGMTLGTFDYISPEQALDPRAADCRSDIYSLGCSLYQMLTGRPPVPEGTAARKLHAHQSEAPIDPRQLNPEIPDAVAAVLSRMMAKDPHDRYQRPEYLVQHLLQLLQQYGHGSASTAPEQGQLFVETILPRPPKQDRGMLFLIAASILLGWLTLQRLLFPSPLPAHVHSFGQPEQVVKTTTERPAPGDVPDGQPVPPTTSGPRTAQTATELQQALRNFSGDGTIQLTGSVYDLTIGDNGADACLLMTHGNLTLQGSLDRRPVLRLRAGPASFAEVGQEQSLLTQRGGTLTLRRVRIELEGGAGLTPMTALVVQGGLLTLEECELVQKDNGGQPGGDLPLTILRAERANDGKGGRSRVECRRCIFYGGQNGFVLEDHAYLQLHQCVVGAYRNPVRLQSRKLALTPERMDVEILASSWLLNAPALITTDNAQGRIVVERSVISAPAKAMAGPQASYLWVQGGDRKDQTELRLAGNYFHGLNGLVAGLDAQGEPMILAGTLEELASHKPLFQDEGSVFSDISPWTASDPLTLLAELEPRAALEAFRVKTSVPELRLASAERIKGAHQVLAQNYYISPLETLPKESQVTPPFNPRELVVDPSQMTRPGVYRTISSALGDVETEKEEVTILLRINGPLPVRSLDLGNRQIILKAAPGFKPELVLMSEPVPAADGEAVLFRLHDGSLQLERLALRLDGSTRDMPQLQSLVTITGTGRCKFLSCQATLLGESEPRAAVVALSDPTGAMSGMGGRPPRAGMPSIEVEDTLIRGRGDFLAVRASRPFQLEMRNAVVALFGSLLSIDGNRSEMTPMIDTARASIKLERLTTYVTQSLMTLRSTLNQNVHVKVEIAPATTCLFAMAEGSPLVRIDGVQNEQDLKRRLLFWNGDGNGYSTSGSLLVWQSLDRTAMPHQYNREGWGELWGRDEKEPRYAREVRFSGALPLRSSFADITPSDLRVTSAEPSDLDLSGKGADLPRVFCLSEK